MDKFYLVWNPKGHSPTVQHSTYPEAEAEAKRIAIYNARKFDCMEEITIHILESTGIVTAKMSCDVKVENNVASSHYTPAEWIAQQRNIK